MALLDRKHKGVFFFLNFYSWVNDNLSRKFSSKLKYGWNIIWGTIIYWLWQWHNKRTFDEDF